MRIAFEVRGMPAPQGSKRVVVNHKTGRAMLAESSKAVKPWRQDVVAAAVAVRNGAPPLDGPLVVRMIFTLPKPTGAPKTKRTWPMRKPDLSKLVRSTEDALVDAGLIVDDARIVRCTAEKCFPNEDPEALDSPGVRIEVSTVIADAAEEMARFKAHVEAALKYSQSR